jgi:hypothetical protein
MFNGASTKNYGMLFSNSRNSVLKGLTYDIPLEPSASDIYEEINYPQVWYGAKNKFIVKLANVFSTQRNHYSRPLSDLIQLTRTSLAFSANNG